MNLWPSYPEWAVTRWLRFEYRLRITLVWLMIAAMILNPYWWR